MSTRKSKTFSTNKLSYEDFYQIEKHRWTQELCRARIGEAQLKSKLLDAESKSKAIEANTERTKAAQLVAALRADNDSHQELLANLSKKYKLSPGQTLAFDPETLELNISS